MANRIDELFARLRSRNEKGFIAYICAGDPNLQTTESLAFALEECGVDILELGVPFSDPLADGIVNQMAAQRALESGTTVRGVFDVVRKIRERSQLPIVIYTYLNPVYVLGPKEFHRQAEDAGVDGLLILDLPPDEDVDELHPPSNVKRIRLIAPTTPPERAKEISASAEGFVYYISREGVTGEQSQIAESLPEQVTQIRRMTSLPIAVGFGISNPQQAREIASAADAVVIGSAIVKRIGEHGASAEMIDKVTAFVRPLVEAVKM
jgi:tryptophan synthase alpha chain